MLCPHCNATVNDEAGVCPACGRSTVAVSATPSEAPPATSPMSPSVIYRLPLASLLTVPNNYRPIQWKWVGLGFAIAVLLNVLFAYLLDKFFFVFIFRCGFWLVFAMVAFAFAAGGFMVGWKTPGGGFGEAMGSVAGAYFASLLLYSFILRVDQIISPLMIGVAAGLGGGWVGALKNRLAKLSPAAVYFSKSPPIQELVKFAPDFVPRVIKDQDKLWFVKCKPGSRDQDKRDRLAYLLGQRFCNVCEVKLLSDTEHADIKLKLNLSEDSNKHNTFLVRLAGSYSLSELPCQTIEKAVATELVYSIWIRRRDAHALNRVYLDGIPIFFDHETAFLAQPHWAHSTMFFRDNPDYGHPGFWRVKTMPPSEKMETMKARKTPNFNDIAHHYVYSLDEFKKEIVKAEESIKNLISSDLKQTIVQAGFNQVEAEHIDNFLKNNLLTLPNDIEQMKEIIFLP